VQRSQVFSTSQRFTPPNTVPALFHAGNTHGVLPSRGFPSLESERLPTPAPLLILPPGSRSAFRGKPFSALRFPLGHLQGFNPPASPFIRSSVLPSPRSRSSPEFFSLQGSPRFRDGHAFTHPPLTHFQLRLTSPPKELGSPLPCAPESHSRNLWLVSPPSRRRTERLPSFLEFIPFSLFTSF
jgi:hypothetical protein